MSRKPDKAAKRKAKLKARKFHAEQHRLHLAGRVAGALMDLCADVLPEYVDDSKGPDLVGRNILWRMGMVAWNIAVTGRKEIDDSSVDEMRVDAESKKMVRDEINGLVRRKYEKFPGRLIPRAFRERNRQAVNHCDLLLAVWNGKSHGTKNTPAYAQKVHKPVFLLEVPEELQ